MATGLTFLIDRHQRELRVGVFSVNVSVFLCVRVAHVYWNGWKLSAVHSTADQEATGSKHTSVCCFESNESAD